MLYPNSVPRVQECSERSAHAERCSEQESRFWVLPQLAQRICPSELYRDSVQGSAVGLNSYCTVVDNHRAGTGQMFWSAFEILQMSCVEMGQVSALETGQVSVLERRQMPFAEIRQSEYLRWGSALSYQLTFVFSQQQTRTCRRPRPEERVPDLASIMSAFRWTSIWHKVIASWCLLCACYMLRLVPMSIKSDPIG